MTSPRLAKQEVDWVSLRQRLDEACAALEQPGDADPAREGSLLERRAALLARPVAAAAPTDTYEAITFRLGSESCAIQASFVMNVFRLGSLALLPGALPPVHGVTMWRGDVLTLLDLRGLLGISTAALTDLGRVIVVGRARAAFGFMADSVTGVRVIGRHDVHSSSGRSGGRSAIVGGITSDALLVLNGEEVINLANHGEQA